MPDDNSGRRWTAAVVLIVVLALAAIVAGLVLVFVDGGAAAADPLASVVAAVLAAMVAAAGVLAWARRRRQLSLPATAEQIDQATATLAGLVREQWQEEAKARALGDPEPMPVRRRLSSPALMDHAPVIMRGAGELTFAGRSDKIAELTDQFRALPRHPPAPARGPAPLADHPRRATPRHRAPTPQVGLGMVGTGRTHLPHLPLAAGHPSTDRGGIRFVGRADGRAGELAGGRTGGLTFGLVGALGGGVMGALTFGLRESPAHAKLRLVGRIPELLRWLAVGLVAGLMSGLAAGLASFVGSHAASPTRSYRGDRTHSMSAGLASGLTVGLAIGLVVGLAGVLAGVLAWIGSGASLAFAAAASQQAADRRLPAPWRVMTVLDDCHRLGLLRTVGPVYQFRHAELQDHLAPPTP